MNEADLITEIETLRKSLRTSNEDLHEVTLALEEVRRENAGLQVMVGDHKATFDHLHRRIEQLTEERDEAISCLTIDLPVFTVEVCYRDVQAQTAEEAAELVAKEIARDDGFGVITAVFDSDGVQVWTEGEANWPGPVELPKLHHDNTYQGGESA